MSAVDDFRSSFPEFADAVAFPDAQINFWNALAVQMLDQERWANIYSFGIQLFMAHQLALQAQSVQSAVAGSIPGMAAGVVQSEGAGDVSASYDTQSGIEENAGHWNLTVYGKQFIRLARIAGMGGVQL